MRLMTLAVLSVLTLCSGALNAVAVGDRGPNFKFNKSWNTPQGFQQLDDYRGKFVLVTRWATWAKTCLDQIPHLEELNKNLNDKGFEICAASDEPVGTIAAKMINDKKVKFGLVAADIVRIYDWSGVPHSWLLDREFKCLWHGNPQQLKQDMVEKWIKDSPPTKVERAVVKELAAAVRFFDNGEIGKALNEIKKVADVATADDVKADCAYLNEICGRQVEVCESRIKAAGTDAVAKVKALEEGAAKLKEAERGDKWAAEAKELKKSKEYEASVELNKLKAEIDKYSGTVVYRKLLALNKKYPETAAGKEAAELAKKYKDD